MRYNKTSRLALSVTIGNCFPSVGKTISNSDLKFLNASHYLYSVNNTVPVTRQVSVDTELKKFLADIA